MQNASSTSGVHHDVAMRMALYMRDHYAQKISLHHLAKRVHMHDTYISEIFKREHGLGYAAYLSQIRIDRAAFLLLHTNNKVAVVGRMVGFPCESSFRRAFHRNMGVSPAQYRKDAPWL